MEYSAEDEKVFFLPSLAKGSTRMEKKRAQKDGKKEEVGEKKREREKRVKREEDGAKGKGEGK